MIAVVNYGAGNLHSVQKALERVGATITVSCDPEVIGNAEAVILPGVGAAADTMAGLARARLVEPIREVVRSGRPFLGVCIGLQVLLTASDEDGGSACLDVVPGTVRRIPAGPKVPHMGWNQVNYRRPHAIFDGIADGAYFYFVHSYHAVPDDPEAVLAETEHGITFCSAIAQDNLVATQFHPEKSGDHGLRVYFNFCRHAGEL